MTNPSYSLSSIVDSLLKCVQTSEILLEFYTPYKYQCSQIGNVVAEVEHLLTDLRTGLDTLQSLLEESGIRRDASRLGCYEAIYELQDEKEKIIKVSPSGARDTVDILGRQIPYSCRRSTLSKLGEAISEIRYHLASDLQGPGVKGQIPICEEPTRCSSPAELINVIQISTTIRDWLKAPNATTEHTKTYAKWHIGTGQWFITGREFTAWLSRSNSFLWLNGRPGCGKSVLCSAAIQCTFAATQRKSDIGMAFFYFKFDGTSNSCESAVVRALLQQLASQSQDSQTDLTRLHTSCKPEQPTSERGMQFLLQMVCRFKHVYIFLDALDETCFGRKPEEVLTLVDKLRKWRLPGMHLLVTSRDQFGIRASLDPLPNEDIVFEEPDTKADISNFLSSRLTSDASLRKWRRHQQRIQDALISHSHGIFRYVECQFEALRRCPRTEYYLEKYLQSLPRDLDETYERMLGCADEDYAYDTRRILALLCYSYRPLSTAELADAYAVNIEKLQLNPGDRQLDFDGIKIMCKGLIEFSVSGTQITEERASITAWLSHPSVQQYLMSDYIWPQNSWTDPLRLGKGHTLLSKVCLVYLLEMNPDEVNQNESTTDFPLARYAAQYWYHHYERSGGMSSQVDPLILKLFKDIRGSFKNWMNLWDADEKAGGTGETLATPARAATPVYVASFLGLNWLLEHLLAGEKEENCGTAILVNEESGCLGNALQAASFNGHEAVVHTLLQKGAHVDQQGGRFGNALQAASYKGHEKVVRRLLDHGINIDYSGGEYVNSVLAASYNGHLGVFRMLLNSGADTSAQLSDIGNALQVASWRGHTELVNIMLEKGAFLVNASSGQFGSALHGASYNGHMEVVQTLLKNSADANNFGGRFGYALQAASLRGQTEIVEMLLDKGADINAIGGRFGNALQAASLKGHEGTVRLLLEKGADTNIQYGKLGNVLQAASWRGHQSVVQMLLDSGARVNTLHGQYGSALQAASLKGHGDVVQLLLDKGADPNLCGGEHGTALIAASHNGHEKIVQMLINRGADVNAQADGSNAFAAALSRGHQVVMQLLIAAGAME